MNELRVAKSPLNKGVSFQDFGSTCPYHAAEGY